MRVQSVLLDPKSEFLAQKWQCFFNLWFFGPYAKPIWIDFLLIAVYEK